MSLFMPKGLYMWHIPKTGGLSISVIGIVLRAKNELSVFPTHNPELKFDPLFNYSYIQGHYGTLPVENNADLETAILLRDPLDRSISNFIWLYMEDVLTKIEPYKSMSSMIEKLKYYLFQDETFLMHRNMQTRFLSNKVAEETVNFLYGGDRATSISDDTSYPNMYIHWFLQDENTSINTAKLQIDKATILGVTDNHNLFTDKVTDWFRENYDLDLTDDYNYYLEYLKTIKTKNLENGIDPYLNFSNYTDTDGTVYTTESLKTLLTQEDIEQVYENNALDLELYNYAKEKLQ
jgi:hypothetical protein